MEFTKEGLALIETSMFAKKAHDYLAPWRAQSTSDTELTNLVTSIVAWAATGHDISEPPAGGQSYELTAFVLDHLKEINDLQDVVFKNMLTFQVRS